MALKAKSNMVGNESHKLGALTHRYMSNCTYDGDVETGVGTTVNVVE